MRITAAVKACLSLYRIRIAEGSQYRMAALSGSVVSIFYALIEIIVYTVFYTYGADRAAAVNGLALPQVVTYVWIAQALYGLQAMSIDGDTLAKITNGDVGIELCRPLDLYAHWFVKTAAGRLGGTWLRGLAVVAVALLMPAALRLGPPASPMGGLLFALSMVCAYLLCTAYAMLITAVRLHIVWGDGPTYMLLLLGNLLSGAYLPLQLWPDFLQKVLLYQPFAGYLDIPARLYVGSMPLSQAGPALCVQLAWTLAFIVAGKLLMARRLRTIVLQGG